LDILGWYKHSGKDKRKSGRKDTLTLTLSLQGRGKEYVGFSLRGRGKKDVELSLRGRGKICRFRQGRGESRERKGFYRIKYNMKKRNQRIGKI